jgi:DNA ligase-1
MNGLRRMVIAGRSSNFCIRPTGDIGSSKKIDSDSDDAPPSKRRRTQSTTPKKTLTTTLRSPKARPGRSPRKSPKAEKGKVVQEDGPVSAAEEEEDVPVRPARRGAAKKVQKATTAVTGEEPFSEKEEEDPEEEEEDEDDERPEEAAKAREQVLVTLKGSGKDPYPDWEAGKPVPYAALCTTFHKIEMTTKRLEILAHCSLFLRQVLRLTPDDLLETVLMMINKLGADYTGIELGIGESFIMKAIGESTGRTLQKVREEQNEIGDLGLVAAKSRSKQGMLMKPAALTVKQVFHDLTLIAKIEGQGAQGRKVNGIKKLLSAADVNSKIKIDITQEKGGPSEAKYIVRTLEGKLRLGLADKSVLVALAQAVVFHRAEFAASQEGKKPTAPTPEELAKGESILKSVYSELPSYEIIIPAIITSDYQLSGVRELCKLQPGIPLKPMLAKPTKSITEVLDRFDGKQFTCEFKYDGERAQIHFVAHDSLQQYATSVPTEGKSEKGIANVFSRNSEDLSKKYPDILAKLPTWIKDSTKSFVLDCESVAWDVNEKKLLPFQQLMTRKRKDVKVEDVKVKVCVFAFDLLFLNGEVRIVHVGSDVG